MENDDTSDNSTALKKSMKQTCSSRCQVINEMEIKNKDEVNSPKKPSKLFPIFVKQKSKKTLQANFLPDTKKIPDTPTCATKSKVDKYVKHSLHIKSTKTHKKKISSGADNQSIDTEIHCCILNTTEHSEKLSNPVPNLRRSQRIKKKENSDKTIHFLETDPLPYENKTIEGLISEPRGSQVKKRKNNANKSSGKINRTKRYCRIKNYDENSSNSFKDLESFSEIAESVERINEPVVSDTEPSNSQSCTKHIKIKECQISEPNVMMICNNTTFPEIQIESSTEIFSEMISPEDISPSLENVQIFPLISHCHQLSESEFDFVDLTDEDCSVKIPVWEGIVGITNIKSFINCHNSCIKNTCLNKCGSDFNSSLTKKSSPEKNNSDVMWTDYAQTLDDVPYINKMCADELKSWLSLWKARYKQSKLSETSTNNYDSSDSNDSTDNEMLNSIIVSGFSGSGKNYLITSVANDLGFTVLEVNASSCRSGRQINLQLKEAFQSYHVENNKQGDCNLDLSVFTDCTKTNIKSKSKECKDEYNVKKIRNNIDCKMTPKVAQTVGGSKHKSIGDFFKKNPSHSRSNQLCTITTANEIDVSKHVKHTTKAPHTISSDEVAEDFKVLKAAASEITSCKISNLTVILFDDIDVVLDDDEGFWYAVNEFLKISKKPVIFTVGRNLNALQKNIDVDSMVLKLNLVTEDIIEKQILSRSKQNTNLINKIDIQLLCKLNAYDIRKCMLNAQFWTQENKVYNANHMNITCCLSENNCFLLQSVNFTTNSFRDLLFSGCQNLFSIVMHHHMLGIDLFYLNLYGIFNICVKMGIKNMRQQDIGLASQFNDKSFKITSNNCCNKGNIIATQKDNLTELDVFFLLFLEFSFADALKGPYCKKTFKWKSNVERILCWNAGLPACVEENWYVYDETILEILSLIPILYFRKKQSILKSLASAHEQNCSKLFLDFPTVSLCFNNNKNKQLEAILPAIPLVQHCNKIALNLDYLSAIKNMSRSELQRKKKSDKRSGRFLHYFDSVCFLINETDIGSILDTY